MEDLARSLLTVISIGILVGGAFRFFPMTRKPWLAASLAMAFAMTWRAVLVEAGDHHTAAELFGDDAVTFFDSLVAGGVVTGLFYEWRERSGRAYAGYASLSRVGRWAAGITTGLLVAALSLLTIATLRQ